MDKICPFCKLLAKSTGIGAYDVDCPCLKNAQFIEWTTAIATPAEPTDQERKDAKGMALEWTYTNIAFAELVKQGHPEALTIRTLLSSPDKQEVKCCIPYDIATDILKLVRPFDKGAGHNNTLYDLIEQITKELTERRNSSPDAHKALDVARELLQELVNEYDQGGLHGWRPSPIQRERNPSAENGWIHGARKAIAQIDAIAQEKK